MIERLLTDHRIKYLIVGGTSVTTEYITFLLLVHLGAWAVVANIVSFSVGIIISFYGQRTWVFKGDHKHDVKRQFIAYITLALINMALTSQIIFLLVNVQHVMPWVAKIITMALVVIWNFAILNKIIFRRISNE